MNKLPVYIVLASSMLTLAFVAASNVNSYKGYAYEKGNKNPIYTEAFTDKFINGSRLKP